MYKDGGKLVKVVHLDNNQFDELILSFASAYYEGPCMEHHPWVNEAELMQVYRVRDLTFPHITTFVRPTRDLEMWNLEETPEHLDGNEWWNDENRSVEASVDAFHNQLAHIVLNTEPPMLNDGSNSMQLTRQHLAPNDPTAVTFQSTRHRSWSIATQPRPSMWFSHEAEFCIPMNRSKSFAQALAEADTGKAFDSPTADLRSRALVQWQQNTQTPSEPLGRTKTATALDLTNLHPSATQFDRGVDVELYEDGIHVSQGELVTPLDLKTSGREYVKFLCNYFYECATSEDLCAKPTEYPTSIEGTVALTMKSIICPFIISESPSDFDESITLLVTQNDANLFFNMLKKWSPRHDMSPIVQVKINMAIMPQNWTHYGTWDQALFLRFHVSLFLHEKDFEEHHVKHDLKHQHLMWPVSRDSDQMVEVWLCYDDWEPWRAVLHSKVRRTSSSGLPCLRPNALTEKLIDPETLPDWTLYPRLDQDSDRQPVHFCPNTHCFVLAWDTLFWNELVGQAVYLRGVDQNTSFTRPYKYRVKQRDVGHSAESYKKMWYFSDSDDDLLDWSLGIYPHPSDGLQPLSYSDAEQFHEQTHQKSILDTPVSPAPQSSPAVPSPTSPREEGSSSPLRPPPKEDEKKTDGGAAAAFVPSSTPPGLPPPEAKAELEDSAPKAEPTADATAAPTDQERDTGRLQVQDFPNVKDLMNPDQGATVAPGSSSAVDPAVPAADPEVTADPDADDAGTAVSSKRRQIIIKFEFSFKHVSEEILKENGDVNTKHPKITSELARKLMALDIERKIRSKEFLPTQKPRESRR